jgi:hypothetical protein
VSASDCHDLTEAVEDAVAELAEIAVLLHMSEDSLAGRVLDVATRLRGSLDGVTP